MEEHHTVNTGDAARCGCCGIPSCDLEVLVFRPPATASTAATQAPHAFVFVHPWGLLGGSWHNVMGLGRRCALAGHPAVVFNLRGVGNSTGSGTLCGHKEVRDVMAVCNYFHAQLGMPLWVVAQSAGATTAGSAIARLPRSVCRGGIFIGYTFGCATSVLFGRHYHSVLRGLEPDQRCLFILGTKDCFTTRATMLRAARSAIMPCALLLLEGAGHFELEAPQWDARVACWVLEFAAASSNADFAKSGVVGRADTGEELLLLGGAADVHGASALSSSCVCHLVCCRCCDTCTACVAVFLAVVVAVAAATVVPPLVA